jgi:glyoxylase-like metal-dependent hydrolase (beta-lactamase superfamily II)
MKKAAGVENEAIADFLKQPPKKGKHMKLYAIEGNTQKLDGGAMFGNAPRPMWEGWAMPDERNRISLACRALLVVTDDGQRILFEAGVGAFFEPKLKERFGVVEEEHVLLRSLSNLGLSDADIDVVVLSHLHFDHAGGVLSAYGEGETRLLFPKAKFYVGKRHWERAKHPHSRDRASFVPLLNDLLEKSGRLHLVDETQPSPLAPLVDFIFSDGHTIGLMLSKIHLAQGPLVFATDLIPGAAWVHVPISMGYDRFPELVIDEKRELLEALKLQEGLLFFTHDPKVIVGKVTQDLKGKFEASPLALEDLH